MTAIHQKSWDGMVAQITAAQGELEEIGANRQYCGPILSMSDQHALQKIGRKAYTVHTLNELDRIPALNCPKSTIRYRNGRGFILDDEPEGGSWLNHERDILAHELKKTPAR
jgi:hypothetical protein